ncbi:hypothetical protein LSH36_269g02021 [Paralvinella palmiformis]|uniref:Uncharacterized protein n=1 Tax=Paralvinella palmiformis TaxID=53620 RepID=A0AAD9JJK3_9ANNE|nr:hypothetical protein LSH36_269g02021 [Paralvinella palmiformis]
MNEENWVMDSSMVPQLKYYNTELPEYFSPWMKIGKVIDHLLETHQLRDEVDKMPFLEAERLSGHKQLRLANLILSQMTSGYVWQEGDKGIIKTVPKQLAIPMCYTAERLGLPKIATHSSLCAANWKLIDPNGPVELSNLATITNLPGGFHCSWFFLVTAQVELCAVPGIKLHFKAYHD